MPRSSATLDAFSAVAEPRRRQMLGRLAGAEHPVNDLVESLGWPQPQVSKHLSVLRRAGLVRVRRDGRRRLYSVNAERLKPIHDWVSTFEKFWSHQLLRVKERAEAAARQARPPHE